MTPDTQTLTIAIIQARMGSSRLPGKVLQEIAGKPMLDWVVERTRRAETIDQVVVATTTEPTDDALEKHCAQQGYPCSRGSLYDVLDRYYQAARQFGANNIVRITADCPLIDPQVIDRTVKAFFGQTAQDDVEFSAPHLKSKILAQKSFDYAANRRPPPWSRTYPIGLDTEVCTFAALETAWHEATEKYQREHVMPFFYENPQRFRLLLVNHPEDFGALRWTVDTAEDLEALRQIVSRFPGRDDFTWLEILELYQRAPELAQINAQVQHNDYLQTDERQK